MIELLRSASLVCVNAAFIMFVGVGVAMAHGSEKSETASASNPSYDAASHGTRLLTLGPVTIKMLVDASNLGNKNIEVGELNLPVDFGEGAPHAHGSLEIFYVVDGILGHEVNGVTHRLEPGDVGFVKPGDKIRHSVLSDTPMKAVVIWLPGGEADALVEHVGFKAQSLASP